MTRVIPDVTERVPFLETPVGNGNVPVIEVAKVSWGTTASRPFDAGLAQGYHHDVVDGGRTLTFSLKTPVSVERSFSLAPNGDAGHRNVIDLVPIQNAVAVSEADSNHNQAESEKPAVEPVEQATGLETVIETSVGTDSETLSIRVDEIAQVTPPISLQQWLQQEQNNPNLQKSREQFLRSLPPPPQNYLPQRPIPVQTVPHLAQRTPQEAPVERNGLYDLELSTEGDEKLGRLYLGGHFGYDLATYDGSYTDGSDTVVIDGFSGEGINGGAHVGIGGFFKGIYFGGEAEYDYGNVETSTSLNFSTAKLTRDHSIMVSGRLGYPIVQNTLGYLRFGVAHSRWSTETSNGLDDTSWLTGLAFGAGVDYSLGDTYSIRGEMLGIRYKKFNETLGIEKITFDPSVYSFRVGLDYQF